MTSSKVIYVNLGLLGSLYFSQGLPFGFFTQALPVLMRDQGYSLREIGLSSLLALPWAIKFLWAPLVDRYGSISFGKRRTWIIPLQLVSASALFLIGFRSLSGTLNPLLIAVFFVNLLSATQDIATDGLAVDRLSPQERGLANGIQVAGYRLGMIIGGGLLLIIYKQVGWSWTFTSMGLMILFASIPVLLIREFKQRSVENYSPSLLFGPDHFLRQPGAKRLLAVIISYKLGDAFAVGMIRPFFKDMGLTLADIGWLLGTVGFTGGMLGALSGGALVNRIGRRRGLIVFGFLQMFAVLGYAYAAYAPIDRKILYLICGTEHFVGGMATAALFTCMMDWCRPQASATDYTVQASAVVIATGVAVSLSGFSAQAIGYFNHFMLGVFLSLISLLIAIVMFPRKNASDESGNSTSPEIISCT
jgi:MFS transporter, PAT family, beta-lactamase induction signal transducer AmpG